ncbi:hypothetical protein [uncultured Rikenella sp.]|uniref:hypothetical protein n=1 Tax=uncultured Rikenella sp. TaxID=368003 RepID=UPI00272ABE03|nr:hypothetical protein [uncultured Rikenella sp.]
MPRIDTANFRVPSGTAPGYRERTTGELMSLGKHGFSWSSETNGMHGVDLSFHTQYFDAHGASHRAHGFQLRCLSE